MIKPEFITEIKEISSNVSQFIIGPLPQGFGHTLGNALRRTLLSSIPGAAVTYVKISGVSHPFTTIAGVKDSVLDIILNIKLLRFKTIGDGPFEIHLSFKGKRKIYGKDFKGGNISVVNGDQYIAEIVDSDVTLEIDLLVEKGVGYSPAEEKEKKEFGVIAVDSVFSPVLHVNYQVEGMRVGRKTNLDKLILTIKTDGTITPKEALRQSTLLLGEFFNFILSGNDKKKEVTEAQIKEEKKEEANKKLYEIIIDELDLPTRVVNALLREKIETVGDLIKRGKEGIVNLKGLGKKSIDLIEKELTKLGINFS